jgi:hypothetical protein
MVAESTPLQGLSMSQMSPQLRIQHNAYRVSLQKSAGGGVIVTASVIHKL